MGFAVVKGCAALLVRDAAAWDGTNEAQRTHRTAHHPEELALMKKITTMAGVVALAAAALVAPAAGASAVPSRSFVGCPYLYENGPAGPCVARLQDSLNAVNDGYQLTADGQFGASTRIAVLDFQGRNGLGADGLVGGGTADELERQVQERATPVTPPVPPQLSPFQRCQLVGPGYVSHGPDRCIRDGAVPMGRNPLECAREQVSLKTFKDLRKKGYPVDVAKDAAKKAGAKTGAGIVLKAAKCLFVDVDAKTKADYTSVPMP